jgi:Fe-S cluster assembly ATP-binding protein
VLLITHYQRILNYIKPDFVHILMDGRIAETGGPELALSLEEHGYTWLREKNGNASAVEKAQPAHG